jgi:hypothetical protein
VQESVIAQQWTAAHRRKLIEALQHLTPGRRGYDRRHDYPAHWTAEQIRAQVLRDHYSLKGPT